MEKIYFTIEEMIDSIKKISAQLVDSNYDPEVIISINRGGCTPGIYLSHYLNKPHEVINIELRDSNIEPDLTSIKEKIKQFNSVLIIDDINDSGATLWEVANQIYGRMIAKPKFATLVSKETSEFENLIFGYKINKTEEDDWVVFPWE